MEKQTKKYSVQYSHNDGRNGTVEVVAEVVQFLCHYGNGKAGIIRLDGSSQTYDLRYCKEQDLHRVMLQEYFGEGIVAANEL